jgi:uncharacterized damage-inducible protein DinB
MSVSIAMEELLAWNEESALLWKGWLEANPAALALPCGIGGAATVQDFVRHIWGVELRWAERLQGGPETPKEALPTGPVEALYDLHRRAAVIYQKLLAGPGENWEEPYTLNASWLPAEKRTCTRRKILAHALLHSPRHWAQLATLVRTAGLPSGINGDLLFSSAVR